MSGDNIRYSPTDTLNLQSELDFSDDETPSFQEICSEEKQKFKIPKLDVQLRKTKESKQQIVRLLNSKETRTDKRDVQTAAKAEETYREYVAPNIDGELENAKDKARNITTIDGQLEDVSRKRTLERYNEHLEYKKRRLEKSEIEIKSEINVEITNSETGNSSKNGRKITRKLITMNEEEQKSNIDDNNKIKTRNVMNENTRIQEKPSVKERLGINIWERLGSRIPETRKDTFRKPVSTSQRTVQLNTNVRRLENKELEKLEVNKPTPFRPIRSPIYSPKHFETNQTFQPNLNESTQNIPTNWDTNMTRKIFNHNWKSPFVTNEAGKVNENEPRKARSVDSICDSVIDPIKKVTKWKKVNASGLPQKVKQNISHLELSRHPTQFMNEAHNLNRKGLKQGLINELQKYNIKEFDHTTVKELVNSVENMEIEDGEIIQGPEIKTLMMILRYIRIYSPKINHIEGKMSIKGIGYIYRKFDGYLKGQLKMEAVKQMIKEPVLKCLLENVGYENEYDDAGLRYLHCAVMKCWKNIIKTRVDNQPIKPGDLMDAFNESKWQEVEIIPNQTELKLESKEIEKIHTETLAMSLWDLKSRFPLTYHLNMIEAYKSLIIEWTTMGEWTVNPTPDIVTIHKTMKAFEQKYFYINRCEENKVHTVQIPASENIEVKENPNINILLGAGYINDAGMLRKHKSKADNITIGQRIIKDSHNVAIRTGVNIYKTFRDVQMHAERSPSSDIPLNVDDLIASTDENTKCLCTENQNIPVLQTQICYPASFYEERNTDTVEDLTPWVNPSTVNMRGINPAMNSYDTVNPKALLAPSEPGAIVSSVPHKKTSLFCGTENENFMNNILKNHGDIEMVRTIEKEINQNPERISTRIKIGEEYEEILKKAFGTVSSYIAGNPIVPPTVFLKFDKFCSTSTEIESWEVKDVETLINEIQKDLRTWKEIKCPFCFENMHTTRFRLHYLKMHPDSISLLNTCDMIQSNKRAFIAIIMFITLCLEEDRKRSVHEAIDTLKREIVKLKGEIEMKDKAPGYVELDKELKDTKSLIEVLKETIKGKDTFIDRLTSEKSIIEEKNRKQDSRMEEDRRKLMEMKNLEERLRKTSKELEKKEDRVTTLNNEKQLLETRLRLQAIRFLREKEKITKEKDASLKANDELREEEVEKLKVRLKSVTEKYHKTFKIMNAWRKSSESRKEKINQLSRNLKSHKKRKLRMYTLERKIISRDKMIQRKEKWINSLIKNKESYMEPTLDNMMVDLSWLNGTLEKDLQIPENTSGETLDNDLQTPGYSKFEETSENDLHTPENPEPEEHQNVNELFSNEKFKLDFKIGPNYYYSSDSN